ncbi:hypothetical protein CAAU_1052 [Caloramator australicus RC3]|uniref:Uncharacterized protein n=1 Tax=Caloramator australicus RC3 TaxID=857293 RepID=I7J4W3_9CLOT|nr:hypothetical protein CAAU_1052 [Caloramator australicus RC3]
MSCHCVVNLYCHILHLPSNNLIYKNPLHHRDEGDSAVPLYLGKASLRIITVLPSLPTLFGRKAPGRTLQKIPCHCFQPKAAALFKVSLPTPSHHSNLYIILWVIKKFSTLLYILYYKNSNMKHKFPCFKGISDC